MKRAWKQRRLHREGDPHRRPAFSLGSAIVRTPMTPWDSRLAASLTEEQSGF
jgi:hypothetical protein